MKKFLASLILVSATLLAPAQVFEWATHVGGNGTYVYAEDLEVGPNDDYYMVGMFAGPYKPVPNATPTQQTSGTHCFIQRHDKDGNLIWFVYYPDLYAYSVIPDHEGNVYVAGVIYDTVDVDLGPGVTNLYPIAQLECFILKLDSNGNFVWGGVLHGDHLQVYDLAVNSSGDLMMTGFFRGTIDFNLGAGNNYVSAADSRDIFVARYNSNSGLAWARAFGDIGNDYGYALEIDHDDNLYVVGEFASYVDFDPFTPSSGELYATGSLEVEDFIVKFDDSGGFDWCEEYNDIESARDIAVDRHDNLYVVGTRTTYSLGIIRSGLIKASSIDGAWQKLDLASGDEDEVYVSVDVSPSGRSVSVFGWFTGQLHLWPFQLSTWEEEGFFARFDSSLVPIDVANMGYQDRMQKRIAYNSEDDLFLLGDFENTFNANPYNGAFNLNPYGERDGYVVKLSCLETFGSLDAEACFEYVSPSGMHVWDSSGTYSDTIANHLGCDSILSIDLTINTLDFELTLLDSSIAAVPGYDRYEWVSCDSLDVVLDSSYVFFPEDNGYYAVWIENDSCFGISDCQYFSFQGTPAGEEKLHLLRSMQCYPNPAKHEVTIQWQNNLPETAVLEVFNSLGNTIEKRMVRKSESKGSVKFNTQDWPRGMYLFSIQYGNEVFSRKVVLE